MTIKFNQQIIEPSQRGYYLAVSLINDNERRNPHYDSILLNIKQKTRKCLEMRSEYDKSEVDARDARIAERLRELEVDI